MKHSVESIISFSISGRRPEFTPSLVVTYVSSYNISGQTDFTVRHDSLRFIQSQEEQTELLAEMSLLQDRVKKFDIQPNILWPVSSKLPNYRWYVFRDLAGRFYAFLFIARITEKILLKFYEKIKNAVSHGWRNPDVLQKKIEDMIFKFNDYSYKESISEFLKKSNFDMSEISSKKDTWHTNGEPIVVIKTEAILNIPEGEQNLLKPLDKAKLGDYDREQRLMRVKLLFSLSLAISALIFILDMFWKLHRQNK